ncbi:MAG: nitrate reductase cytochrome c-type subunit [Elusimicrobia bacterium]|nr:nitrate reductase cytochrome c-type subunit [Elusimicrobiota bacterium]
MKFPILAVVVLSAAVGAGAAEKKARRYKGLQEGRPGVNLWNDQAPGSTKPLPRPYPGAPPLVPHDITGLVITRRSNACLDCHLEGTDLGDGHTATKVPPSHFTNPKTKEVLTGTVTGTRYQCLQCHAPQTK